MKSALCIRSIPVESYLKGFSDKSLTIRAETYDGSFEPVYYQEDDGYPSPVQVCKTILGDSCGEVYLAPSVAEMYLCGEDILQHPLFLNEEISYDKDGFMKRAVSLSHRNDNQPCYLDDQEDFPLVFLPEEMSQACSGNAPKKPAEPIEPVKPKGRALFDLFWYLLFWLPVIVVFGLSVWLSIIIQYYGLIVLGIGLGLLAGILLRGRLVSRYNFVRSSEMKLQQKEYLDKSALYEKHHADYEDALADYETKLAFFINHSRTDYIRYLLSNYLEDYTPPEVEKNTTEVRKGPAEELFIQYLRTTLGDDYEMLDDIKTKHTFKDGGDYYFYPDVALRHRATGLMVDIEIDEPYVAKTGQPIHGKNDDSSSDAFFDSARNEALTSDSWVLIRFAEEQIVRFPAICLSFIETICSGILNHVGCERPYLEGFVNKVWSYFDARSMAEINYRQTYLPASIQRCVYVPPKKEATRHYDAEISPNDLPF